MIGIAESKDNKKHSNSGVAAILEGNKTLEISKRYERVKINSDPYVRAADELVKKAGEPGAQSPDAYLKALGKLNTSIREAKKKDKDTPEFYLAVAEKAELYQKQIPEDKIYVPVSKDVKNFIKSCKYKAKELK